METRKVLKRGEMETRKVLKGGGGGGGVGATKNFFNFLFAVVDLIADLIMVPKDSPGPEKKRRKVSICYYCVERQFIFCSSHFIFC
jgi:hypothetical protein